MNKKNNGITLIALVITIIVMLILVGVSISMAVNGGLFNYAGKAVGDTKNAINAENEIGEGGVKVDGKKYNSIDEYVKETKKITFYIETQDLDLDTNKNAVYTFTVEQRNKMEGFC